MSGINRRAIPQDLIGAVEKYEKALMGNDVQKLSQFFASDPDGIPVSRVDNDGWLSGKVEISDFRSRRGSAPTRFLKVRTYRMLSCDAAVVVSEFDKSSGGVVDQTQVWERFEEQWKIVSAHLTYPTPAIDSRIWRVVGSPLKAGKRSVNKELPLQGLSVAVKDLYGVEGFAIGAGSEAFLAEGRPQSRNAWPVQRLLDAGADITGIARTDEFAYSLAGTNAHYGTPPNPQAPGRISGGSSSGSASATALGQVDVGLGSDTGGSVRVPSAYQHLWGIRTTRGSIPMEGVLPLAQSFDTVGWMTRSSDLLKKVAKILIPEDFRTQVDIPEHVIWSSELIDSTHLNVATSLHAWIRRLNAFTRGNSDVWLEEKPLDEILGPYAGGEPSDRLSEWLSTYKIIQGYEAWKNHGAWIEQHWSTLGSDVASRFRDASELTEKEYRKAIDRMLFWKENLRSRLGDAVLLVPSSSSVAPSISDSKIGGAAIDAERTATMRLTCISGLAGLPAVNIPLRTAEGLPCGICVVGPAGSDLPLIDCARKLAIAAE